MENKYKVMSFSICHYGGEYLRESLLSVKDHVDKVVVAYSRKPSQGFASQEICPETEMELYNIARNAVGDKLVWDSRETYSFEAQHRAVRYEYSQGYDMILIIDPDEVFEEKDIENALDFAYNSPERYFGIVGYYNFWRNFDYVCTDGFRPIRIENLRNQNQLQNLGCNLRVYHFSLCQKEAIIRYKYKVFGHADEIKKNYLEEIFYAWTPEKIDEIHNLHPTSNGVWGRAEEFDKNTLPDILKQHPNFNKSFV